MRLVLIRHGRTASNVKMLLDTAPPGGALDDLGQEQADSLVQRLDGCSFDAVYSSNLTRAEQTAAPLAIASGVGVTVLSGLREISAGEDEMSNNADRYHDVMLAWYAGDLSAMITGGEDGHTFLRRYDQAIAQIAAAGHDSAALVSHGAALRVWCRARIAGIRSHLGEHSWLINTGYIVADGDPTAGWRFVTAEGIHED